MIETLKKNILWTPGYFAGGFLFVLLFICNNAFSQDQPTPEKLTEKTDTSAVTKSRPFNQADFGFTTARLGMAFINDWAWYSQDDIGKAQLETAGVEPLANQSKVRDFRVFSSGKLNTRRELVWKIAIMYDGVEKGWTFRETGLLIGIPELSGKIFLGRSKEGFSMVKVQNGYSVNGHERQPALDPIPIMTDGIRYYGDIKKPNLFWSIGAFSNLFYGHSRFMPYKWTISGRFGWLPLYKPDMNMVVHLGVNYRMAEPVDQKIQIKSKPESNPAPNFVDTGMFDCDLAQAYGSEAHFFKGPLLIGSEIFRYSYNSVQADNPKFWGGNITFIYNLTGESYPYTKDNAVSFFVHPKKSIFQNGFGAWQAMLTGTIYDTNDGLQPGGSMWKASAIISWFLSDNFTTKFSYGFGKLDRFNTTGTTQDFQIRFQFQLI